MELDLAYGDSRILIDIPDKVEVSEFAPRTATTPVSFEEFKDLFVKTGGDAFFGSSPLLIVVNDSQRPTPTPIVLDWLNQINPDLIERAEFLVATGTHPNPSEQQLKTVFGTLLEQVRDRIRIHDCRDQERLASVGLDQFDQDVKINRTAFEAEKILVITSVEPHYFAGFSGGRKSFIPGLADFDTIERNHNLANSLSAAPMRLTGNPVAEHLENMLTLLDTDKVFTMQLVTDAIGNIASMDFGDIRTAFMSAINSSKEIYAHAVDEQFDLVVCEMRSPLDHSLYQAQKGLENCRSAVKEGGAIVVVAKCDGGGGSPHFFNLAKIWDKEKNEATDGVKRFGSHKLSRVNALSKKITVGMFSSLDDKIIQTVFYKPINDLSQFIHSFSESLESMRIAVVRDAGNAVLVTNKMT